MRYEFSWPPKELSPNARVHWAALRKAKVDYEDACGWIVVATGWDDAQGPVTAQVTFVVPDKIRRDTDNFLAMLKPMWDVLVTLGALQDDSHDKLKIAEPKWEIGEKKVIVELTAYRNGGE